MNAFLSSSPITTLLGWVTRILLAFIMVVCLNPHSLDGLMPPDTAVIVAKWCVLISTIIGFIKDHQTQQTPSTGLQMATKLAPVVAILLLPVTIIFFLSFGGCVTDPATGKTKVDWPKVGRVSGAVATSLAVEAGHVALGVLWSEVQQAASSNHSQADLQAAASTAVWKSVGTIDIGADAQRVINAWNGGSAPEVAAAAARVFDSAKPRTEAEKVDTVKIIAATMDDAIQAAKANDGKATVTHAATHPLPYAWPQGADLLPLVVFHTEG